MENAAKEIRPPQSTERQSNFELLRILAMIFITAAHWSHGLYGIHASAYTIANYSFYHVFRGFGQTGVVLYMLISGYFLCKSDFRIQSFLRIYLQVVFTSALLLILHSIVFPEDKWSVRGTLSYLFLLANGDFWFVRPYIITFLLSPLINFVINKLDKSLYVALLVIVGLFLSVFPSVTGEQLWSNGPFINVSLFIFVYLLGAYFRFFPEDIHGRERQIRIECLLLFCVFLVLMLAPCITQTRYELATYFQARSNFLTIGFATMLFLVFKQAGIRPSKTINVIGASTFGIYIFHENFMARNRLWSGLFHIETYVQSPLFIPYSIAITALVFVVCSLVDIARKYLLEKPLFSLLNRKFGRGFEKINALLSFKRTHVPAEDYPMPLFLLHAFYTAMAITLSVVLPCDAPLFFLSAMVAYCMALLVVWRMKQMGRASRVFLPPPCRIKIR